MAQQRAAYPLDYSQGPEAITKDHMSELADNAEEIAAKVAEQARIYGEKAQDAAKNFKPFMEKSMKDQPMSTLAAAAVIGFALGALWKK
jgi:ElaB/YqjD/DUF883 family membrane-anchored ribosome-binding protein